MHQIRRHFLVAPTKYSIQPPIHKVRVHLADHLTEEPVFGAQAVHQRRYFLSHTNQPVCGNPAMPTGLTRLPEIKWYLQAGLCAGNQNDLSEADRKSTRLNSSH